MSAKEFRKRVQDAKRLTPHQRQVSQGRIRPSSQSQASAKRAEGAWLRSRRARNAGTAGLWRVAAMWPCPQGGHGEAVRNGAASHLQR
jgi:hypothetical protein